jgi:hypothetical protein
MCELSGVKLANRVSMMTLQWESRSESKYLARKVISKLTVSCPQQDCDTLCLEAESLIWITR